MNWEVWLRAFMPHRHCYGNDPLMTFVNLTSSLSTGFAYMIISGLLVYGLVGFSKSMERPAKLIVSMFATFVLCCGIGHMIDAVVLYRGWYGLQAAWRSVTAEVSLVCAFGLLYILWFIRPQLESLTPSSQDLMKATTNAMAGSFEALMTVGRREAVFNFAPFMIMVIDKDGVLIDCNQRFQEVMESDRGTLIGTRLFDYLDPDPKNVEKTLKAFTRTQDQWGEANGLHHGFENNYRSMRGTLRRFRWFGARSDDFFPTGEMVAFARVLS